QPGEGIGLDRLRIVEPAVATEHLVRALAGQRHRRVLAHLLEQSVERWPHVAPEGRWQVEGANDLRTQRRIGQLAAVEDDLLVTGADLLHQVAHEGRIGRTAYGVAGEAAAVVDEVDGEGADV